MGGDHGTKERTGKPGKIPLSSGARPEFKHTVPETTAPRENLLVNLICNIAVPTYVLTSLSKDDHLGPVWGLGLAILFPIGYGIYDFARRRRTNFISVIGFCSVLLTGVLGLMHVGGMGFAIKEAVMPTLIGAAILFSVRTSKPLVKELIYNDQIIDVPRVNAALAERGRTRDFERLVLQISIWLGASFVLSAGLNFSLASYLLRGAPGTPEFNAQLGRMHLLAWPVIVVPSMLVMMLVFWRLISGLKQLTGLTTDELLRTEQK
ncbi:MAG: hypothetical protein RL324_664 [Verrucomicrobiota bacterium]|jgi:hypothetical protein